MNTMTIAWLIFAAVILVAIVVLGIMRGAKEVRDAERDGR
jgi:hypothetical protein